MKVRFIYYFVTAAVLLWSGSCKDQPQKVLKIASIEFKKEGELSILKQKSDSLLTKINIEIAESDYETETGLMYRKGMGDHEGMLFIFPDVRMHSFYMKNTEFSLDIIFIDVDKRIATIRKNTKPLDESSVFSEVPVQYVLEINAGLSDKWNLEKGDTIEFTRQ